MTKIGIVGNGFVGKATALIQSETQAVHVYDTDSTKCQPVGTKLSDFNDADLVFICVPTPATRDGKCHTGIVEAVIKQCRNEGIKCPLVVRSTVPVGFCFDHNVHFFPEFLTEKNWQQDFVQSKEWIIGVDTSDLAASQHFVELMHEVKRNLAPCMKLQDIVFVTTREAEMIKYFRNCYLATKVSFCNEMEEFCRAKSISYEEVRRYACRDERIGSSHSMVPGPDGKRGFGGTCFPKDVASLIYQQEELGLRSFVLTAIKMRNEDQDRPECDWQQDKGRAVV